MIGLDILSKQVEYVSELIKDHTKLLRLMWEEDQYKDFLLGETLQDSSNTNGLDVQPMDQSTGIPDLSPINDLVPNVIVRENVVNNNISRPRISGDTISTIANPGRITGDVTPTQNFAKGGLISPLTGDRPESQSLEKSGFDDTFEKNISTKLEDDFQLPAGLKKAFGDSMSLPARAAAVALADMMGKMPVGSKSQQNIVNNNLNSISSSFGLNKNNTLESKSNVNKTINTSTSDTTKTSDTTNSWAKTVNGGSSVDGMGTSSSGTLIAQERLNLLNPFDWPRMLNEADKARKGERPNAGDHELSAPGNILKWHQRNAEYMKMLSSNTSNNSNVNSLTNMVQSGSNFSQMSQNLISNSSVSSISRNVEGSRVNLTELTDNVIAENRARVKSNTEISQAQIASQSAMPAIPNAPSVQGDTAMASSEVRHSPFFDSYTSTAQFS